MISRCLILVTLVIFYATSFLQAQIVADSSQTTVHADPTILAVLEKRKAIGTKNLKGYRVKIHFGAEKAKANEIKAKFCQMYPDIPAYMDYDTPNFSITVGNFRTRLESFKVYKEIQSDFPNAFMVEMKIDYPDLTVKKEEPVDVPKEEEKKQQ
jgi:hypothetical protein